MRHRWGSCLSKRHCSQPMASAPRTVLGEVVDCNVHHHPYSLCRSMRLRGARRWRCCARCWCATRAAPTAQSLPPAPHRTARSRRTRWRGWPRRRWCSWWTGWRPRATVRRHGPARRCCTRPRWRTWSPASCSAAPRSSRCWQATAVGGLVLQPRQGWAGAETLLHWGGKRSVVRLYTSGPVCPVHQVLTCLGSYAPPLHAELASLLSCVARAHQAVERLLGYHPNRALPCPLSWWALAELCCACTLGGRAPARLRPHGRRAGGARGVQGAAGGTRSGRRAAAGRGAPRRPQVTAKQPF